MPRKTSRSKANKKQLEKLKALPIAPGSGSKTKRPSRANYESLYKRFEKLKEKESCSVKEREQCMKKMNKIVDLIVKQDKASEEVTKLTNEVGKLEKQIMKLSKEATSCKKC